MEASVAAECSGSEVSEILESWPCGLFHWSKKFWPFLSWHELKLSLLGNRGRCFAGCENVHLFHICLVPQTKKWTQGIRPVYLSMKTANKRIIETFWKCACNFWTDDMLQAANKDLMVISETAIVSSISLKSQKTKLAVHILKARPSNNYRSTETIHQTTVRI